MSKPTESEAPKGGLNRTAGGQRLVGALMLVLTTPMIAGALTTVSACGKTESFGTLSSANSPKSRSALVDKDKVNSGSQPEDQSADAPQSVAGMYLTCGEYTPSQEDPLKDPSIGCNVADAKGQRVAMQNLQERKWTVKNKDGGEVSPFIQESKDSVRIFATHNTGGPNDVKTVELEAKLKNSNKLAEKITFAFPDGVKQLALAGIWNVTRTAPSGSNCLGSPVKNPSLNAGKLDIKWKPGSTSDFTAVVNGGNFTLDYDGATSLFSGTVNKTATPGTPIFGGSLSVGSKTAQASAAQGQNVLPADKNPSPTLNVTTGADGSVVSMQMVVNQPCYGTTYWNFTK